MKEIGIGIIGTGFMGKAHSIAYSASSSVFGTGLRPKLKMVCDLSPQRASQRATDLGFSGYSNRWQDVVNNEDISLISICTPNDTHAEIAIAALEKEKHVWCEKPMSTSIRDSIRMCEAAKKSQAKTIVGYNYTKNPTVMHARRLIEAGKIGRITGFFCRYDIDNEANENRPWSWRMSRATSGTGVNGDILSHVISNAHYLIGARINRVIGDIAIIHQQRRDPQHPDSTKTVDNDDMVSALIHFENGVHGTIAASRVSWGRKCALRWEIHGTLGTIIYEQERLNELKLFTKQDDLETEGFRTILTGPLHPPYNAFLPNAGHSLGYMDIKVCELHTLLEAIEHNTMTWPDFEAGLEIEKVMDSIDQSALNKHWIDIAY